MKICRRWLRPVLIFAAILGVVGPSSAEEPSGPDAVAAAEGYEEIAQRLRAAITREMEQKGLPALSIALVEGDRVVWAEGFGAAGRDKKERAAADTVYRVGSVSKLFTDIAVMQLVEQGKVSLDAPITDYLPDFRPENPFDVPVTLRQLMSHRSGLVREPPVGHYFDPDEPSLEETVASLNQTALVYRPGTKTKYSNAAITVVGRLLEKIAGVPFAEQIDRSVLAPLEMHGSGFELTPPLAERLATAWMWTYDGRRFEAPRFPLGTAPAGNLYSSASDLSKFLMALFNEGRGKSGAILRPETLKEMISPHKSDDGEPAAFAIGFHVEELDGHRKIGHGGAVYGFSTQLEALPERKLGVVAAASLDGSNGVVGRITDHALRLMLARQDDRPLPELEATEPVPLERARQLAGRYKSGEKSIELTARDGRLELRLGSLLRQVRLAGGGELVVDDLFGYGPPIVRDENGGLSIEDEHFARQEDAPPPAAPAGWRGLIGEYGWDHNTLYILEDHGRLVALIEWFYYYPLIEIREDEFAFPDYGLYHGEKLIFTRDEAGEAAKVAAAEVSFARRSVGTREGETFRITPVRPIDELRGEALKARPPAESGEFREADLVEPAELDPTIKLDIRYATTNNFTGAVFYRQPKAFMQRTAAEAVVRANRRLKERGLGLLIHDAYRPWHVTRMFWDATPDKLKQFVANPSAGSRHNRGCAVDLTLYDLETGEPIPMVAGYDEFSPRSFPAYPGGTSRQRWHRELLRRMMEAEGFTVYEHEWWHFDFQDWRKYRIQNDTFEEILKP